MRNTRLLQLLVLAAILGGSYFAYGALGGATGVRIPYSGYLQRDATPISGNVSLVFDLWNAGSGGTACYTTSPMDVTVSNGRFSVVIGPVTESCVADRDVWLSVTVDDGTGPVALPDRQRIYPGVASVSSGSGDFRVQGNLVVGGQADFGLYLKTCTSTSTCQCNAGDKVVSGGADCGINFATSWALVISEALSNGDGWYATCDNTDTAGLSNTSPLEVFITCARVKVTP